jgi:hypothetical protein
VAHVQKDLKVPLISLWVDGFQDHGPDHDHDHVTGFTGKLVNRKAPVFEWSKAMGFLWISP